MNKIIGANELSHQIFETMTALANPDVGGHEAMVLTEQAQTLLRFLRGAHAVGTHE